MSDFTQCETHEPISTPHCPICLLDERDSLRQQLEQSEMRADACQQQAQIWKQEARTQSAIVTEIYQELTGKTGEPGDWSGERQFCASRQKNWTK